jgi:hypothetical protein
MSTLLKMSKNNWADDALSPAPATPRRRLLKILVIGAIILAGFVALKPSNCGLSTFEELWLNNRYLLADFWPKKDAAATCPQVDALLPESNGALWTSIGDKIITDSFQSQAVSWLSGAVKVPYVYALSGTGIAL